MSIDSIYSMNLLVYIDTVYIYIYIYWPGEKYWPHKSVTSGSKLRARKETLICQRGITLLSQKFRIKTAKQTKKPTGIEILVNVPSGKLTLCH